MACDGMRLAAQGEADGKQGTENEDVGDAERLAVVERLRPGKAGAERAEPPGAREEARRGRGVAVVFLPEQAQQEALLGHDRRPVEEGEDGKADDERLPAA